MTATEQAENWKQVWAEFGQIIPLSALEHLRDALKNNDPKLIQGKTSNPPAILQVEDWPVEQACVLGFCGVMENGGFGFAKVRHAEAFFAAKCAEVGERLGLPSACQHFLSFVDDTPRERMRAELLPEVERAIAARVL